MSDFWFFFKQNRGALVGMSVILLFLVVSFFGPWLAPHDPTQIYEGQYKVPPRWYESAPALTDAQQPKFLMGTDDVGRDLLSRLIYGARVSLGVGFLVVLISASLGTLIGLLAGYYGGWVDSAIMRGTDVLMALPSILLAIVVVSILGPGLINAVWAVSLVAVPSFVRLVRASVMSEKQKQYVIASKSFGASHFRNMFINILPNCMAPLIVQATLGFSEGILNAAALGFLGLGAQAPTPEWGTMLADARQFIQTAPWLVLYPGFCIMLVVLGFNLFGDGLRDALDPRLRR